MRRTWPLLIAITLLVAVTLTGLADFDTPQGKPLAFTRGGIEMHGTLFLPHPGAPVAVIVHGDGPQDRLSGGGYLPLINALFDAGIGTYSWDKPGVGESAGNWLDHSMADRSKDAQAARNAVIAATGLAPDQVGYLGFSQAGWVLPRAAAQERPGFTILIGAAVNWRVQGRYFERIRLQRLGLPQAEITQRLFERDARNAAQFTPGATSPPDMNPARFHFVARAYNEDARSDIAKMTGPVLALWGAKDPNVDAAANAALYRSLLPSADIRVIPNAGHPLLRARWFNTQLQTDWSWPQKALFLALGRRAYAPNTLDSLALWIKIQIRS